MEGNQSGLEPSYQRRLNGNSNHPDQLLLPA